MAKNQVDGKYQSPALQMTRYLALLSVVAVTFAFVLHLSAEFFPATFLTTSILPLSLYFFVITAAFHVGLVRASSGKPALFIRYYMAATSFKLLIHMMLLVICAFFYKTEMVRLTITFLVFYLFYTAYEVAQAYRHSRKSQN